MWEWGNPNLITVVVVTTVVMPSQTVNFERGQYQYILATSNEGEFSKRVRELVEKGMGVEEDE